MATNSKHYEYYEKIKEETGEEHYEMEGCLCCKKKSKKGTSLRYIYPTRNRELEKQITNKV